MADVEICTAAPVPSTPACCGGTWPLVGTASAALRSEAARASVAAARASEPQGFEDEWRAGGYEVAIP